MRRWLRHLGVSVLTLTLALAGCSKQAPSEPAAGQQGGAATTQAASKAPQPAAAGGDEAAAVRAEREKAALAAHAANLALLPADTDLAATVDLTALVEMLGQPLGTSAERAAKLKADMGAAFQSRLGVNPLQAGYATVGLSLQTQRIVAVFPGVGAEGLAGGADAGDHVLVYEDGFYAAKKGSALLIGNRPGVIAARALTGDANSLARASLGSQHVALSEAAGGGMLVATAATPMLKMLGGPLELKGAGLDAVGVRVGANLSVAAVVEGDEATVTGLEGRHTAMLTEMRHQMQMARQALRGMKGVFPPVGEVMLAHAEEVLPGQLKLTRTGKRLMAESDALTGMGGSLPMVGVLAAVAIPAFVKYQARAKTTEAIDKLDKIYKGAAIHFVAPRVGPDGTVLPCSLPQKVGPTPAGSPCDYPGGRYPANMKAWDDEGWVALSFAIPESHRYRYTFETNGKTGADMQFTASAYGDLDCDGVWSTFQRMGFGAAEAGGECSLQGNAKFYVEKETE